MSSHPHPASPHAPDAVPADPALWLPAKHAGFVMGTRPRTPAGPHQILVRNRAIAVNPVDRMLPAIGDFIFPWLRYPAIVGSDVAGEVVEVGPGVTRFRVGDRVAGHALGVEKARNAPAEGAFQAFTLLLDHMATPLPEALSFEAAAVLPLGLSTAACGLFQRDFLALRPPAKDAPPTGESVLVWGGATSVGSNAIQLARAAGYDVVATASPRNFEHVRSLGARVAVDYRSPHAVRDLVAALRGRPLAGALAIGVGASAACVEVAAASAAGRRFVAIATPPASFDAVPAGPGRWRHLLPVMARVVAGTAALAWRAWRAGVPTRMIWGGSLWANEVGPMVWRDFLPAALAEGRYRAAPAARVVGEGLAAIPEALALHARGVSAAKLVVRL